MEVLIRAQANNCLRVTIQTEPYKRKSLVDCLATRERERLAIASEFARELRAGLKLAEEVGSQFTEVNGERWEVPVVQAELARVAELDLYKNSRSGTQPSHSAWFRTQREKSFSPYARQSILEAGTVIDREHQGNVALLTLTIPGSSEDALRAVSEASGWIVDRQMDVFRKLTEEPTDYYHFFVWEFQKRGALHQHWAISHKDSYEKAEQIARDIERIWFKCLWELQVKTGIDCFERRKGDSWRYDPKKWQSDLQKVNKSVGGYFAKYASKNAQHLDRLKRYKSRRIYYPSRWWGCSANLKKAIQEWRIDAKVISLTKLGAKEVAKAFTRMLTDVYKPVLSIRKEFDVKNYDYDIADTKYATSFCSGVTFTYYFDNDEYPEIHTVIKELIGAKYGINSRSDEYIDKPRTWLEVLAEHTRTKLYTDVNGRKHGSLFAVA